MSVVNKVTNIKVSVCVLTYNQVQYIEQCLLSLIDQVVDFDFEIIVGDDCSTDGTSDIVRKIASQYPRIVKAVVHPHNVGITNNYLHVHSLASGEYIAHVDGDDYALPGKLQAQSDFLDMHPSYNIVWHRMLVENPRTGVIVEDSINLSRINNAFIRKDIFRLITIGMNSSKMYRASVRNIELPDFPLLDYFANVEQVGEAYAGFVNSKPLGVYRTGIGIASSGNKTKVLLVQSFKVFLKKYKNSSDDISVAVSFLFVAALKNFRIEDCKLLFPLFIKLLSLNTLPRVLRTVRILSMLRIPSAVKNK